MGAASKVTPFKRPQPEAVTTRFQEPSNGDSKPRLFFLAPNSRYR